MQKFSNEERKNYNLNLRKKWFEAKKLAESEEVKNKYQIFVQQSPDLQVSMTSFAFVLEDMIAAGYDGNPYIDCKTFKGWKDNGFIVKKGERSRISGLVWKDCRKKEEVKDNDSDLTLYPKAYHLFHSSQVEAITK